MTDEEPSVDEQQEDIDARLRRLKRMDLEQTRAAADVAKRLSLKVDAFGRSITPLRVHAAAKKQ